jgi:hypothetical protein
MDRWEYRTVNFPKFLDRKYTMEKFIEEMNSIGAEGWELAAATIPTNSLELVSIFKRKIVSGNR